MCEEEESFSLLPGVHRRVSFVAKVKRHDISEQMKQALEEHCAEMWCLPFNSMHLVKPAYTVIIWKIRTHYQSTPDAFKMNLTVHMMLMNKLVASDILRTFLG